MIRHTIVILFFICAFAFTANAQINLLQNPSFEDYTHCPNNVDQIGYAKYWSPIDSITYVVVSDTFGNTNCSPEYCNTCDVGGSAGVPLGFGYNHYPRTDNGMVEVQMYYNDTASTILYRRDYLQGRLKTILQAGAQYCVTFYVCQESLSAFGINNIGIFFDDGTIDTTANCGQPQTTHIPQIMETSIITDTLNWTKIQGSFIANGTEKFATIGNFKDDLHTDTLRHANPLGQTTISWYLVDDISVIKVGDVANAGPDVGIPGGDSAWIGNNDGYLPCKWYYASSGALIDSNHAGMWVHPTMTTSYVMELDVCGVLSYDTVTVHVYGVGGASPRPSPKEREVLLPNPARDEVNLLRPFATRGEAILRDMTGRVLGTYELISSTTTIDISQLASGVYLLEVNENGDKTNLRLVKE